MVRICSLSLVQYHKMCLSALRQHVPADIKTYIWWATNAHTLQRIALTEAALAQGALYSACSSVLKYADLLLWCSSEFCMVLVLQNCNRPASCTHDWIGPELVAGAGRLLDQCIQWIMFTTCFCLVSTTHWWWHALIPHSPVCFMHSWHGCVCGYLH